MKKVKIEERLESALNAFFDASENKSATDLAFAGGSAILSDREKATFTDKSAAWINAARQLFLFLPGAFILYVSTLANVYFTLDFGFVIGMLFWVFTGGFFCFIGLGSLKATKNLLIPSAIFLFAAVLGALFSVFSGEMRNALYFEYSIYLFPLVLVMSSLLKSRLDANENHLL